MSIAVLTVGAPSPAVEAMDERYERIAAVRAGDRWVAPPGTEERILAIAGRGRVDADLIASLPNLRIIAHYGVGYDPVDVHAAARQGVIVTNTPDVLTDEVADTAMGLLLMAVRELSAAERWLRAGRWLREGDFPLTRGTLAGRRLGILGLGRIGLAIARRAEAFGLTVAYHNRREVAGSPYPYHPTPVALAEAVDTLVVVLPGGQGTRHLVGADVLGALGPHGILINVGRGSVVDEAALVDALERGAILGAGLDVFEHEPVVHPGLLARDDVVLLPHVGSASLATRARMAALQADNITAFFETGAPLTPVAETPFPATTDRGGEAT